MEQSWKEKKMENLHAMFEFYWQQKQQQAAAHCTEKSQLHEEHPDVCDE